MWKLFQAVPRVLRTQWCNQARPTPQVVSREEDPDLKCGVRTVARQQRLVNNVPLQVPYNQRGQAHHERPSELGSTEGAEVGSEEDCEWWEWRRCSREGFWYSHSKHVEQAVEALTWGTAIVLGIQLTKIWEIEHNKRRRQYADAQKCMYVHLRKLGTLPQVLAGPIVQSGVSTRCNVLEGSGTQVCGLNHGNGHWWEKDACGAESERTGLAETPKLQAEAYGEFHEDHPFSLPKVQPPPIPARATPEGIAPDPLVQAFREWDNLAQQYTNMRCNSTATKLATKGQHDQAVPLWERAGSKGYAKANFNLGVCYEMGTGVKKDLRKAVEYYSRAATEGHSKGMFNLAVMYLQGAGGLDMDPHQALVLLEKAAEQGFKKAQTELGVLYTEDGRRDLHKAASFFTMAAAQKDSTAQYYLGLCYEKGWGVAQNECKAAELYRQAGRGGHPAAHYNLAVLFEKGLAGLPADKLTALEHYQAAALCGHKAAEAELSRLEAEVQTAATGYSESKYQFRLPNSSPHRKSETEEVSPRSLCGYLAETLDEFGIGDLSLNGKDIMSTSKAKAKAALDVDLGNTNVSFFIGEENDNSESEGFGEMDGRFGDQGALNFNATFQPSLRESCSQNDLIHSESASELRSVSCT